MKSETPAGKAGAPEDHDVRCFTVHSTAHHRLAEGVR